MVSTPLIHLKCAGDKSCNAKKLSNYAYDEGMNFEIINCLGES